MRGCKILDAIANSYQTLVLLKIHVLFQALALTVKITKFHYGFSWRAFEEMGTSPKYYREICLFALGFPEENIGKFCYF